MANELLARQDLASELIGKAWGLACVASHHFDGSTEHSIPPCDVETVLERMNDFLLLADAPTSDVSSGAQMVLHAATAIGRLLLRDLRRGNLDSSIDMVFWVLCDDIKAAKDEVDESRKETADVN